MVEGVRPVAAMHPVAEKGTVDVGDMNTGSGCRSRSDLAVERYF
jgi:hypothetical protein